MKRVPSTVLDIVVLCIVTPQYTGAYLYIPGRDSIYVEAMLGTLYTTTPFALLALSAWGLVSAVVRPKISSPHIRFFLRFLKSWWVSASLLIAVGSQGVSLIVGFAFTSAALAYALLRPRYAWDEQRL